MCWWYDAAICYGATIILILYYDFQGRRRLDDDECELNKCEVSESKWVLLISAIYKISFLFSFLVLSWCTLILCWWYVYHFYSPSTRQ